MIKSFITIFFLFFLLNNYAQEVTVCGYVTEKATGEKLISANVVESKLHKGTSTNNYGFFSLKIPRGVRTFSVSYVGYTTETATFNLQKDTTLTFQLNLGKAIDSITVVSTSRNLNNIPVSRFDIPISRIKQLPVLLGESDVFKAIQIMPGIQSGMEGSAGMFVRGGNAGDNLIMIDGIPVYNPNHLYGFFSVFNTDAVKNVSVYKGAFPARFSGGTSSVIDVRMKEGSVRDYSVEGSVGLISSKIKIEGPIIRDKTSFLISGRRTYIDALMSPLKKSGIMNKDFPSYYFYDINAKISHKISNDSHLYLSFYNGNDNILDDSKNENFQSVKQTFTSATTDKSGWGNTTASLRFNQRFSGSLFANATLAYSHYNYTVNNNYNSTTHNVPDNITYQAKYLLDYRSQITDAIAKLDFDWFGKNHTLRFGTNVSHRNVKIGDSHYIVYDEMNKSNGDTLYHLPEVLGLDMNVYAEDEFHVLSATINAGLNYSIFQTSGKTYTMLQPRLSMVLPIVKNVSFKMGLSQMAQNIQLISETNLTMSTDAWVSANKDIAPLQATQFDAGLSWQITQAIGFSIEGYYKKQTHVLGLFNGESLYLSSSPLSELLEASKGTSKGLEFQLNKTTGKTTGGINYTLSKADRTFPTINNGVTFPFKYDRRHTINVFFNHEFSKSVSINVDWLFGTGYPETLAQMQYPQALEMWDSKGENNSNAEYYKGLNLYNLPVYHRLDIGISFARQRAHYKRTWNFGLYNAYNQNNPVYQYWSGNGPKTITSVGLLPIIPYATYNFSF